MPDGFYPPVIEGSDETLRTSCYEKARSIYGENLPELVETRLEKELNSIISNGYSIMYITAKELVAESARNGYQVGSRGSVGSSVAAFMAGITEVNSLPAHYRCTHCGYYEFHENEGYDCGFDMPEKNCPTCGELLIRDGYDIPFETFLGFNTKIENHEGRIAAIEQDYLKAADQFVLQCGTATTNIQVPAQG